MLINQDGFPLKTCGNDQFVIGVSFLLEAWGRDAFVVSVIPAPTYVRVNYGRNPLFGAWMPVCTGMTRLPK